MNDSEKMLLSDAIETAIRSEKKVIIQRRIIFFLAGLSGGLFASCISLLIR